MKLLFFATILSLIFTHMQKETFAQGQKEKTKMVLAGLAHGHSHWLFDQEFGSDIELIGIYEPNQALAERFRKQYGLDEKLFHTDLDDMLEKLSPDGLLAFGPISDHLQAVQAAAPRGIHVMVEKPLAINLDQAEKMYELATKHKIHLLTNYETSWYPSTSRSAQVIKAEEEGFGKLRKAVFHHGHRGPKEIGVSPEFLEWLTDPAKNGGGALVDFGCYGANIMTFLMEGELPISVTAVTQTHKPEIYTRVEDDATIILIYPTAQAIIQASWNWPIDRKDMELYAEKGYITAPDPKTLKIRRTGKATEQTHAVSQEDAGIISDPFNYFAAVIRGEISPADHDLYALENNMSVVRILEAAKASAESGKTQYLKNY
jgi:predicted dehydrogenase